MEEYVDLCTGACTVCFIQNFVSFAHICHSFHYWVFVELSRKIMRGIALALGGSADEFEGERAGDPFWVLRIIGYPGVANANDIGW